MRTKVNYSRQYPDFGMLLKSIQESGLPMDEKGRPKSLFGRPFFETSRRSNSPDTTRLVVFGQVILQTGRIRNVALGIEE
jgi:hypothetical protein